MSECENCPHKPRQEPFIASRLHVEIYKDLYILGLSTQECCQHLNISRRTLFYKLSDLRKAYPDLIEPFKKRLPSQKRTLSYTPHMDGDVVTQF